jgi:hypothetical protein
MEKKKKSGTTGRAYVLRIALAYSEPAIWRKMRVPGSFTLGDLHVALQIAFGWEDEHLHSFTIGSVEYGMSAIDEFDLLDESDMANEDDFYLDDLGLKKKQTFTYLYDFGDSWEHKIQVTEIISLDENPDMALPICLEGERAGALEDSGGIGGYENMLEVLKNPQHEEYQEILDWAGDYDPEYFSLEDTNREFKKTFKPPKKPKAAGGKKNTAAK